MLYSILCNGQLLAFVEFFLELFGRAETGTWNVYLTKTCTCLLYVTHSYVQQPLFYYFTLFRSCVTDCLIQKLITWKTLKFEYSLEPFWIPYTTSVGVKNPMENDGFCRGSHHHNRASLELLAGIGFFCCGSIVDLQY